jgi:hypothetical protein
MKSLRLRVALSLGLLCLVLGLPSTAQAQRRDFAGVYSFSDVVKDADSVSLTITLTVHNFSGADIRNGGAALYPSPVGHAANAHANSPIDAFGLVKLFPSYRDVTLTHRFTVSAAQYARWNNGENPRLQFLVPDGASGTRVVPIDLRREIVPAALAK